MSALQPLDPLLVVADLDPTLANTADAIAPDLLHALYGRALVVAYENGEIEGTHARQYMTAVVGQAYENLNAVKWGPAHFFMRLEDATTWQIRSQRAGMYGKIYPSKWLLAAMQQAYPARQHETYRPKWELLERLLNQHIYSCC